jgi:hypothetical protein
MTTIEDYIVLRNKIDAYLNEKEKKQNSTNEKNEQIGCCVCYESNNIFIVKTDCNHNICMPCLMQLKKTECPMCRKEFPMEITKLLHKSNDPEPIHPWFSWSGTPQSTGYYINYT